MKTVTNREDCLSAIYNNMTKNGCSDDEIAAAQSRYLSMLEAGDTPEIAIL